MEIQRKTLWISYIGRKSKKYLIQFNGRVQCIDFCIHQIVATLNAGGVRIIVSCCRHGKLHGRIDLEDGRVLVIVKKFRSTCMASRRTVSASIHLCVVLTRFSNRRVAGTKIAKINSVWNTRQPRTSFLMNLMVSIWLFVSIHVIVCHCVFTSFQYILSFSLLD